MKKYSVHQLLQMKKDARPKRERYFGESLDTGKGYRPKFVCLECRKVIRVAKDKKHINYAYKCGNCGSVIYRVRPMFKPPPANTNRGKKAWLEIKRYLAKTNKELE